MENTMYCINHLYIRKIYSVVDLSCSNSSDEYNNGGLGGALWTVPHYGMDMAVSFSSCD